MEKRHSIPLRLCVLCLQVILLVLANGQAVRADLMLDGQQIDGSRIIFFDQQPLREIQYNGTVVWRAGADITYVIDDGITEINFVPYGQTTLAVTGNKAGYEFVGWRTDKAASGDVLTKDLCTGDEKTLYAVFRKAVTVSYYNGSATKQTSVGYIYYNNGNISTPEFTIGQAQLSGWTARGWSTGQTADASVSYSTLNHTEFASDVTLYGVYQKTITASFTGNGSTSGSVAAMTGTSYYNSAGNTINPSFKMPDNGFVKSGYIWTGWLQGSTGITRAAGENVTLSANTTFTAQWQTVATNFSYTGGIQQYTVPSTGYYKVEAFGASGGTPYGHAYQAGEVSEDEERGGYGGYACGYKYLTEGTILYIGVGGTNGFNGGTDGFEKSHTDDVSFQTHYLKQANGGGATHISTRAGLLQNLESHKSDILLVAGGGGGGYDSYEPDENGEGDRMSGSRGGDGGSDIDAASSQGFGTSIREGCGGGYYTDGRGKGGSNYIGGCLSTLNYNGTNYSSSSSVSSNTGNGRVTITFLGQ